MPPRRRCPTCGSKQWHKEPSSGLIACSEGHVLQNYRNEATEAEEMGPHALRKRALKSGRKKKEGTSRADPRLYHGARARFHYLECLQLILRKQIVALTRLWDLPPEFEIVCRDVWTLHLNLLPNPPPAEPYYFAMGKGDEGGGDASQEKNNEKERDMGKAQTPESQPSSSPVLPDKIGKEGDDKGTDEEDEDEDEDGDEAEEDEEDEELAALLQENSEESSSSSSSSSEDESETETGQKLKLKKGKKGKEKYDSGDKKQKRKKKKTKSHHVYESPASTLAVLITACWTLRIPVLARDLIRLIESYDLPYLDPIARRLVPESMITHLTKHNIQALSPYHAPNTMTLHALASRLSKLLYSNYGIFTPEANAAPILWRVTEQALGGTPVLYTLIKRLARILSLPLTLHHTLAPGLAQLRARDPAGHNYDNIPPEVGFVAAGVVVLKMVYGLDGRRRLPRDADDPACALPRIDEYLRGLRALEAADGMAKDAVFDSRSSMCAADLDDETTDAYLDFCERALLSGDGAEDTLLANYFPLQRTSGNGPGEAVTEERKDRGRTPVSATLMGEEEEEGLRPGEGYRVYNSRDMMGTLPVDYEMVLGRGARWTGVDGEYLGGVVEKYERRVMRWWEGHRRRAREGRLRGGGGDSDDGM